MCTVTYIPQKKGDGFILTSNRDELPSRNAGIPDVQIINGIKMFYPKEPVAGGTWIAMSETGRVCCLLNGALVPHNMNKKYGRSRGEIILDIMATRQEPVGFLRHLFLDNIQPFTLLIIDADDDKINCFLEFIWDGKKKMFRHLNPLKPHIRSSVTLYNEEVCDERRLWFGEFLRNHPGEIKSDDILHFHRSKHTDNETNNIVMKRDNGVQTISITQIFYEKGDILMKYNDLISANVPEEIIKMELCIPE